MESPMGCDTLAALGSDTLDGSVILAKNSDRNHVECQWLRTFPAASHPAGATLRCQYLAIPQARQTHRVLGSQPFWLWGFEHGVNEHGVAIGNEAIWMKAPRQRKGLLGMDLLRLGLERGATAREALDAITALLEAHGQGGSARFWDPDAPGYDNSFILADPKEAWVLETSGRDWAARRAKGRDSISNVPLIGTDFELLSASLRDRRGLDFARDLVDPDNTHEGGKQRCARSRGLLAQQPGPLGVEHFMACLRDHGSDPEWDPAKGGDRTICMHPAPPLANVPFRGQTVASVVAHLRPEGAMAWCALATPDISPFLPFFVDGEIPHTYSAGTCQTHPESLWWRFKQLQGWVEEDWRARFSTVRQCWEALEAKLLRTAPVCFGAAAEDRAAWTRANVQEMLGLLAGLEREAGLE